MADPSNPADLPPSWLPGATQASPMPPAVARSVARKVKNRRHALVLAMATKLEDLCRQGAIDDADALEVMVPDNRWWKDLAATVGHASSKAPSQETRAAVIAKVRADLAEPYRKLGRG